MTAPTPLRERPATAPIETTGRDRDEVRLLVATGDGLAHRRFRDLPGHLRAGDLVVVNTSGTLPAAAPATLHDPRGDRHVLVHLSAPVRGAERDEWVVELRATDGSGPVLDARAGTTVTLRPGGSLQLVSAVTGQPPGRTRLWRSTIRAGADVLGWFDRHGDPIRYAYVTEPWGRQHYQTVFARHPGSAEMPSAGRPFTERLVVDLVTAGIQVAPVTLHTGVSSQEAGEPPQPERVHVPGATARLVNDTRRAHGRIVAVGTTVTRALETAATPAGESRSVDGWTDLVLGPERPARVVDGLVTGWHEAGTSHLDLLRAVAGVALVEAAYAEAHAHDYAWHEFGDSALLLP